ncbi:unnamed protein product [Brassica napus]|uniref:(rape) hypothetical protein n=1 Tax=Brassica napus TaxID=3708 RepID=A0A816JTK3_BRANA|nr:unnamed protein product [Brassica napus]
MSHTAAVETEGSSRLRALRISLIAHAFGYEVTLTPVGSSPTANILSGSRHGGPCIPSFSSIRLSATVEVRSLRFLEARNVRHGGDVRRASPCFFFLITFNLCFREHYEGHY